MENVLFRPINASGKIHLIFVQRSTHEPGQPWEDSLFKDNYNYFKIKENEYGVI